MTRNPPLIKDMFEASKAELAELMHRRELSTYLTTVQLLSKSLLLSCASYYETVVTRILSELVRSGDFSVPVQKWLERVAVDGQFYKWFDFRSAKNANSFLALFGDGFKERMRLCIEARPSRQTSEVQFLELCSERNRCVHKNYAAYSLSLTIDEIYLKHLGAMTFVRILEYGVTQYLLPDRDE